MYLPTPPLGKIREPLPDLTPPPLTPTYLNQNNVDTARRNLNFSPKVISHLDPTNISESDVPSINSLNFSQ